MKLSVIVVFHNMQREAQRTLYSLSAAYQRNVSVDDYEVIAIDNGSDAPLTDAMVTNTGPNFRYHYLETNSVSPVGAINLGAGMARSDVIAIIVDGARMASPGLIETSLRAIGIYPDPFVCSLSWHLGPDVQNVSISSGYCQSVEDELLASVNWQHDGYRLFEISTLAQSSAPGFLGGLPPECSWLCLDKAMFDELGGYDPQFQSPGGGLVNHDFVDRLSARALTPVVLLGEGVFHQFHGGVATNVEPAQHPFQRFQEEFLAIRGHRYQHQKRPDVRYFGHLSGAARAFLAPA